MNIFKKLFKLKNKNQDTDLSDYPKVSSYIFWHQRSTDTVLIGPFYETNDAWDWWYTYGQHLGVAPVLTHLRHPGTTYNSIWGLLPEVKVDVD